MSKLSDRLLQLKAERHLLQKDISTESGIPLRTYQNYERNLRKPDSETIIKLCNYFNVSSDYLLGLSDDPTRR